MDGLAFGARGQDCSLDGVGLQAPLEGVVPQSDHTVLSSRYKALGSTPEMNTEQNCAVLCHGLASILAQGMQDFLCIWMNDLNNTLKALRGVVSERYYCKQH